MNTNEVIIKKILLIYRKWEVTYALVETTGSLRYVIIDVFSNQVGGAIWPSTRVKSSRDIHVALMIWLRDIENYPRCGMVKQAMNIEERLKE